MKKLWPILVLLLLVAACETNPVAPSDTDDDQNTTQTVIINIGGDDDHSGNKDNGDDGDTGGDVNSPPFIVNPGTQENTVGDTVSLVLSASDPDNDNLTWQWEANSAPRNLGLQTTGPNSAIISGQISSSSATDSPFNTRIIVSDGRTETSTVFLWIVNAAPEL